MHEEQRGGGTRWMQARGSGDPLHGLIVSVETSLINMNAIFQRFNNLILLLVRGKDHVCACTCGRHQVYHVVPYNEAQTMVDSRENHFLSGTLSPQEINVITGLLLGLCISWFLLWLDRVWLSVLKYWRAYKMIEVCCPRMSKFSIKKGALRRYPKHTEDSPGNNVYIDQDVYHDYNNKNVT